MADGREQFKKNLYASLIKQSNFVFRNIQDINSTPNKIKACAAVILSGLVFNEISENSKKTLKELIFEPATTKMYKCHMICPNCNIKKSWCGTYYPGKQEEKLNINKNGRSFSTIKHLPIIFQKK